MVLISHTLQMKTELRSYFKGTGKQKARSDQGQSEKARRADVTLKSGERRRQESSKGQRTAAAEDRVGATQGAPHPAAHLEVSPPKEGRSFLPQLMCRITHTSEPQGARD